MNAVNRLDKIPRDQFPEWLKEVVVHAQSLQFGQILITVHQGRVTQVDATEKMRFSSGEPGYDVLKGPLRDKKYFRS